MRPILLFIFSLLIGHAVRAQAPFLTTFGTSEAEDEGRSIVLLNDGSLAFGGSAYYTSLGKSVGISIKTDNQGSPTWIREVSGFSDLFGQAMCQLLNGDVLLAGKDNEVAAHNFGIMLAGYHPNGSTLYVKKIVAQLDAAAVDIIAMPDNGALIFATHEFASDVVSMQLVRTDANGDTVWTHVLDQFAEAERPKGMVQNGIDLMLCGSTSIATNENAFLIKTDLSGTVQWAQTYDLGSFDQLNAVAVSPAGGYFAVGTSNGPGLGGTDVLIVRTNDVGDTLWTRQLGSSGNDLGYGLVALPDGGVVITGSAYAPGQTAFRDLFLARIDAQGNTLWTRFYHTGDGADTGYDIIVDAAGIVAVGKTYALNETDDILLLRTDMDGNLVGISSPLQSEALLVYPNPSEGNFRVKSNQLAGTGWQLMDMNGRLVLSGIFDANGRVDATSAQNGLHCLMIKGERPMRTMVHIWR